MILTQYFWPENFPINDLARGLIERGHQITVLTGIPNYPEGKFFPGYGFLKRTHQNYHGVRVIRVPLIPRGRGGGLRLALNYISFASCASLLAPFYLPDRYDLIFVYEPSPITVGLPAIVLKKIKPTPIFFWVQDLWPESLSATQAVKSKAALKLLEKMVQFIYKGCDRILIQSRAFSPMIEGLGVERHRIAYFPNSADAGYQPVTLECDAPEKTEMPEGFRVIFAGNIGAAQDFGTLLKAAEILKNRTDIHWVIIGDGRMRPWLEKQIHEQNLTETVHLLGKHPANSMPRYLSLADALLVTLRKETIFALTVPSKIQAYLASGKPIIAALDGEGARIIREAGAGLTVPAETPTKLAEAVRAMYHMKAFDRLKMGTSGRIFFENHFKRSILIDRLESWIKEWR